MTSVNPRRPYRSLRRGEQVRATRGAILQAARQLFVTRGYEATTIASIASEARLATPTVYKHFGSKRRLLLGLIDDTINVRVPLQLETVLEQRSARSRLTALARMCVDLASAAPDVVSVALLAANSDPELGVMFREMADGRRRSAALIARSLADDGTLRPDCDEARATEIIFALASPDLFNVLVTRFDWSEPEFEEWLSDTLAVSLLHDATPRDG